MRGDRHMGTVRSHNKRRKPTKVTGKLKNNKWRNISLHAIGNRGPEVSDGKR